MNTERFDKGFQLKCELNKAQEPIPDQDELDIMTQMIHAHVFGEIYSRNTLPMRERLIVTIVTIIAIGGAEKPLRTHMTRAMKNGITRQELEEICLHMTVYCGYPRAVVAKQLLDSIPDQTE